MPRIGIVSGLLEEAETFRPGAGRARRRSHYYSREGDDGWVVGCAGIGKVNAAMVATEMIAAGCKVIISMGVAGRIGESSHSLFWVDRSYQHDYGTYRSDRFVAFRAGSLPFGDVPPEAFRSIDNPGIDLPAATIVTGDCFIEDNAKARDIAGDFGAELVDMETGAIAQVAAAHRVGWAAIRSVSDHADASGVQTFKDNLLVSAQRAASEVDRLVDLLLQERR